MSEPLDSKKFHVLSASKKRFFIILGGLLLLTLGPFLSYHYYSFAVNRPAQLHRDATFEINKGDGLNEIALALQRANLVNSGFLFKAYVVLGGYDKNIQAGVYHIPAGSSVVDLSKIFQHGTFDTSLTFIEGLRVEEYARLASLELNNIDYEKFVLLAKPYEGYLFPDTYFLNKNVTEKELIEILRNNYEAKTEGVLTEEVLGNLGMTGEEVIILASIVEREVFKEEDRQIVAGILSTRWRDDYLLEADATTQYAVAAIKAGCDPNGAAVCPTNSMMEDMQWWPDVLTRDDLDFDSPYNTRKNPGLPPAPIANPGISAINSVINYQQTDYYFYLNDREGNTHFSRTLDEHNINVRNYLRSD